MFSPINIDNPADLYPPVHRQFLLVFVFNTAVALVLTVAVGMWAVFGQMFVFSQSIGTSILIATHLIAVVARRLPQPRDLMVGSVVGSAAGVVIALALLGILQAAFQQGWRLFLGNIFLGVVFGTIAGNLFFSAMRITQGERALKRQALQRVTAEKQLMETQLRLLQAQIEPRFLFSTLSAIRQLIETHPVKASRMLEALTRFLRAALDRTRKGEITLGDELVLVRAYLEIHQERLGARLNYEIDVPETLLSLPLAPLLIQPLVEQAVQKRTAPSAQGGTVLLRVRGEMGATTIEVSGVGNADDNDLDLGLANIRERLRFLYGEGASLQVEQQDGGGIARITLPPVERVLLRKENTRERDLEEIPAVLQMGFHWQVLLVLIFNTVVALVLTAVAGERYGDQTLSLMMTYSHCIGGTNFLVTFSIARIAGRCPTAKDMVAGILAGALLGNLLAGTLTGTLDYFFAEGWTGIGANIFLGVVFGSVAAWGIFSAVRISRGESALKEQELQRVTAEKQLIETRLRLLQAQIEPHFLFNTLSTIHSLIETHPVRASRMLESLTRFLRATLDRSREGDTTLGDEVALVRAYLDIQQERMGARLRYEIEVPDGLMSRALPPLLLQPLVENAIKHGIEPSMNGGDVSLRVCAEAEQMAIEVSDTGEGLGMGEKGMGVGIANVRERLHSLYGDGASLSIESRLPRGVISRITLPLPVSVAQENKEVIA